MRRWVLIGLTAAVLAGPANAATVADIVTRAEDTAQKGGPAAQAAADVMIDALRTAHAADDQRQLLDGIISLGSPDAAIPATLKSYVRANAAGPLLDLARSNADWTVRGQAFSTLRGIDPPDDVLRQAIAIADADTSPQQGFIHSRGEILRSWLDSRAQGRGGDGPAKSPAGGGEQAGLQYLRAHDTAVSYGSLAAAIGRADPATVQALLEAGIGTGPANAARTSNALVSGLATVCEADAVPNDRVGPILTMLKAGGFPLGYADDRGNTVMLSAAQFCPAPIVEDLVLLGAPADPVNMQQFTPLKMALVSGKWDSAKILVDAGARLTRAEIGELFVEPPTKSDQRALLTLATR